MTERQSLIRGIKAPSPPVDPAIAREFIHGTAGSATPSSPHSARTGVSGESSSGSSRVSLNTKIREDLVIALKRLSFDRQISRASRHTLQEIVEEALEPWLKSQGLLK
jgi:hypothetical protein